MNFTPEDDDRRRGLAEYLRISDSELIRELAREKREKLNASKKYPRLTPREPLKSFSGRRNLSGDFVLRKVRVGAAEKAAILALSQYLDQPCNEMITELAEKKRAEVRANGGNPPVRPRARKATAR
jgi:hypothetical protein